MNLKQVGLGLVLAMGCFCMPAPAEMPRQFYYEDFYATTNGPGSGYVGLQLQLYNSASNGTCLYEDSNTVEVVDGFYATLIGDNTVFGSLSDALAGGETYVQVIIDGTPQSPREPLVPVPYALNAGGVASNTITAAMISSAAVQSSHLASGSVTASKLAGDVDARYVNADGDDMTGVLSAPMFLATGGALGGLFMNYLFIDEDFGHTNGLSSSIDRPFWNGQEIALVTDSVQKSGDTMTGDFSLAGSLILLPTTESVLSPGFQTDGTVTMHWMTEAGTYFKYGETASGGDRFHFGSDGEFKAWGDVYAMGNIYVDHDLAVGGQGRVQYEPVIGTNQYALWVRNFATTSNDARGLLVTTPEYNNADGIIFHAASMAGGSMASRFIVGADGNVGVGVNDPQNKLHVAGDARVSGNVLMMDGQNIISPNFNPSAWGSAFDKWGPNAYLKYGFVRELLVAQNAEFQSKVKIGTSSDYAMLNVGAPTNLATPTYAARFESALGADSDKARGLLVNFPNTTNANSILFHAMSGPGPYTNSRVVIKADGKVGIGTSYPEATLHVHGDARFDQVVWIQPAGDLSMGLYTNGAPE